MSASPAPGPGTTPNGGPPAIIRRKPKTNPLVATRRPPRKPTHPTAPPTRSNDAANALNTSSPRPTASQPTPPSVPSLTQDSAEDPSPTDSFQSFPLITTKGALLEGMRHHIMRLQSKDKVDLKDEATFTRPIRLHRRDIRAPPSGAGANGMDVDSKEDLEAEQERERLEQQKEERRRIREAHLKEIAPTSKSSKQAAFQKRTQEIRHLNDTPESQKQGQLRYEESLPWHLEDFDNKNTWVGAYEAALSDCHIMLLGDTREVDGKDQGIFRMVPLEKWYRFTAKNKFKHLTIEEAEARMSKKVKDPRWFMERQRANEQIKMEETMRAKANRLFKRNAGRGDEDKGRKSAEEDVFFKPEVSADADEIDFNHDELFADDEEGALFEGLDEENAKETEERLKREQREANLFGTNEDIDPDEEAQKEEMLKLLQKQLERGTRKALIKRERNYDYESDDDDLDLDTTDEDDSDAEARKKEEEQQKAEDNRTDKAKTKDGDKLPSGSSSKGTNTPSGRPKHPDSVMKSTSSISLKRPGSPNLSDASGNESSRKKHKKKHHAPGQEPNVLSRPMSPVPTSSASGQRVDIPHQTSRQPSKSTAGSGSDSEGGSGTKLKLRLGGGSPNGTPRGSPPGSRAASPHPPGQPVRKPSTPLPLPTLDEIRAEIPPEGIHMNELTAKFKGRTGGDQAARVVFIGLIKQVSKFDKATKFIYPKPPS